jgi:DNA-directed RNA polymerase subunit RPC12/RpoP
VSKVRTWQISRDKDGFHLEVVEKDRLGVFLNWLIEVTDMEWWGKRKNLPFCWINPWAWTFRVGTEDRNLGGWWYGVGNRLMNYAWRKENETVLYRVALTGAEVRECFADALRWFGGALGPDGEDERCSRCGTELAPGDHSSCGYDEEVQAPCCEDAYELSSHYHCPRCHARVGMMGHECPEAGT